MKADGSFQTKTRPGKYDLFLELVGSTAERPDMVFAAILLHETITVPPTDLEKGIQLRPLAKLTIQLKDGEPLKPKLQRGVWLRRPKTYWIVGTSPLNEKGQAILFLSKGLYEVLVADSKGNRAALCGEVAVQEGQPTLLEVTPNDWKLFSREEGKAILEGESGFIEPKSFQEHFDQLKKKPKNY